MQNAVLIFFLLLLLTAVVTILYFYLQFKSWPPSQWKSRLNAKLTEFRAVVAKADNDPSAQVEIKLKQERVEAMVHAIPLERLADYPNIGPKTVEGLVSGGFKRIDQLWSLNWWRSVPGIGEVRAKALTEAAKTIRADAETKFEAGQNPEGKAWLAERDQFRAKNRAAADERERMKAAAQQAIRDAQPLVDLAHAVTFGVFLFHRADCPITDEVMARPFPEMKVEPAKAIAIPPPPVAVTVPSTPIPAAVPVPASPIDDGQLDRMRAYCRFGFVIARADGRVAVAEKKVIRSFLADCFGQDARLLRHIDPVIEQCENPPPVEDDAVAAVKAITTPAQREELMSAARRIADAAGDRNQKEQDTLDRIAETLGLGQATSAKQAIPISSTSNPRTVLEIDAKTDLSPELIRRRFNILTDQYDPKKAASLGASFVAKAEEMRAAVKAAAETLIAPFGVPLVPPVAPPPATPTDIRHNPDLDAVFGM